MDFWISFWKICFFVVLALFAVLAVFVTIGGYRDIRELFQTLEEQRRQRERDPEETP